MPLTFTIMQTSSNTNTPTLNTLYARVHRLLSHKNPVKDDDTTDMKEAISAYMTFYRGNCIQENVIPKQHILEKHCVEWVRSWGFGLALHGEQGGEEMHSSVNNLKRRAWGMRNSADKLRLLMKEQLTQTSPMLQDIPEKEKVMGK